MCHDATGNVPEMLCKTYRQQNPIIEKPGDRVVRAHCSMTKNETGNFAGALECMPDDILKLLVNDVQITYEPRIDLICLVRLFYLMLHKSANFGIAFTKYPQFKTMIQIGENTLLNDI